MEINEIKPLHLDVFYNITKLAGSVGFEWGPLVRDLIEDSKLPEVRSKARLAIDA